MDVNILMKCAGFNENTPVEKAKNLILNGKWHPRTEETRKATEMLREYFTPKLVIETEEDYEREYNEMMKQEKIRRWGTVCGLLSRRDVTSDLRVTLEGEKVNLEDEMLALFNLDVRPWGSPLNYEVQES